MEEKDNIKELFQDRFKDFEAQVDPGVWNNIQSEMTSSPDISSSATSGSISKTMMWVAAVSVATVSAISIAVFNTSEEDLVSNNSVQVEETVQLDIKEENASITSNKQIVIEESASVDDIAKNEEAVSEVKEEVVTDKVSGNETGEVVVASKNNDQLTVTSTVNVAEVVKDNRKQEKTVQQINENVSTNIVSKAPSSINIESQSRVVASPMGGNAPLEVSFNSISSVENIKWIFDDGEESMDLTPTHVYEKPGVYFVTMMAELENGEVVMDKAVIEVKEANTKNDKVVEESSIFVPNIFTPNGDSENDKLDVKVKNVNTFTISIYCVNGRLVYTSDNPEDQWDGTDMRGEDVEDGVYYYLINAIGENNNVYAPKGYVTVKRSY
ncbi:gliding motility-associated C-terminal domain-containing protein [bacterium SCSIO 12643]|nr:gliding motility-associated C-terminal domain-containing protein [bacterium SCSIO 12643]